MSGKTGQISTSKMPKSSPNSVKQGPMKATIPMSSVLKQGSTLRSSSATVSPTYCFKSRTSPDHSYGLRSPGSSALKGKSTSTGSSPESTRIRRTASLDTVYLKGQWPRDGPIWFSDTLQQDKATQTEDQDLSERATQSAPETDDSKETLSIRSKFKGTKEHTLSSCSSQTLQTSPFTTKLNLSIKPLQRSSTRSSVEGLNQEIERIVLKTDSDIHTSRSSDDFSKSSLITPEGHRAPLAEILRQSRSRSVNTQTPQDFESFSPSSEESQGSSPDQDANKMGTSPRINKFLSREPPDGCEKVHLKTRSDKPISFEAAPQAPSTFKLRPSLDSAFQILQPSSSSSAQAEENLPIVPPPTDSTEK